MQLYVAWQTFEVQGHDSDVGQKECDWGVENSHAIRMLYIISVYR